MIPPAGPLTPDICGHHFGVHYICDRPRGHAGTHRQGLTSWTPSAPESARGGA